MGAASCRQQHNQVSCQTPQLNPLRKPNLMDHTYLMYLLHTSTVLGNAVGTREIYQPPTPNLSSVPWNQLPIGDTPRVATSLCQPPAWANAQSNQEPIDALARPALKSPSCHVLLWFCCPSHTIPPTITGPTPSRGPGGGGVKVPGVGGRGNPWTWDLACMADHSDGAKFTSTVTKTLPPFKHSRPGNPSTSHRCPQPLVLACLCPGTDTSEMSTPSTLDWSNAQVQASCRLHSCCFRANPSSGVGMKCTLCVPKRYPQRWDKALMWHFSPMQCNKKCLWGCTFGTD